MQAHHPARCMASYIEATVSNVRVIKKCRIATRESKKTSRTRQECCDRSKKVRATGFCDSGRAERRSEGGWPAVTPSGSCRPTRTRKKKQEDLMHLLMRDRVRTCARKEQEKDTADTYAHDRRRDWVQSVEGSLRYHLDPADRALDKSSFSSLFTSVSRAVCPCALSSCGRHFCACFVCCPLAWTILQV